MYYLSLITAILQLYFSYKVFRKGREKGKIILAFLLIVVAIWGLFSFYFNAFKATLDRFNYQVITWGVFFIFLFSLEFPEALFKRKLLKVIEMVSFIICSVIFLAIFIDGFIYVKGFRWDPLKPNYYEYSPFVLLFLLYIFLFFLSTVFIFYKKYKKYTGKRKLQLRYIFFSTLLTLVSVFFVSFVLGIFFSNNNFIVFGYVSTLIFSWSYSYIVIENRLTGMRIIESWFFRYGLSAIFVYVCFYAVSFVFTFVWGDIFNFESYVIAAIMAVIFSYFSLKVLQGIDRSSDIIFFKGRNPNKVMESFLVKVNRCLTLDNVIDVITSELRETIGLETVYILISNQIKEEKENIFYWRYLNKRKIKAEKLNSFEKRVSKLKENLIYDNIQEEVGIFKKDLKHKPDIILPLSFSVRQRGFFAFKFSEEGEYHKEAFDFLEKTSTGIAQAIENALLYEKVKVLDQSKTEFISKATHQLRNSLVVSIGFTCILLEHFPRKLKKEAKQFLNRMKQNLMQLNNIINDILNVSNLRGGRFALNKKKIKIASLVSGTVGHLKEKAKVKNIKLNFEAEPNVKKVKLFIDESKIFEVIYNIIDNAINYTVKGSVKVELKDFSDHILVSVLDTGIGIPKDKKDKIFKRFSRLENAKSLRPDGTGIGLYMVKVLIAAHGGEVWFESEEGKGTTFFVKLFKQK